MRNFESRLRQLEKAAAEKAADELGAKARMYSTIRYHPIRDPGGEKAVAEIQPTWPYMLVGEFDSPDDWEAWAAPQQERLLRESAEMMERLNLTPTSDHMNSQLPDLGGNHEG